MAVKPVPMPAVGESITEVIIETISCEVGQTIARGDVIFEVDSDKSVLDVQAPFGGVITKIHVAEADTIDIGAPLLDIESDD